MYTLYLKWNESVIHSLINRTVYHSDLREKQHGALTTNAVFKIVYYLTHSITSY